MHKIRFTYIFFAIRPSLWFFIFVFSNFILLLLKWTFLVEKRKWNSELKFQIELLCFEACVSVRRKNIQQKIALVMPSLLRETEIIRIGSSLCVCLCLCRGYVWQGPLMITIKIIKYYLSHFFLIAFLWLFIFTISVSCWYYCFYCYFSGPISSVLEFFTACSVCVLPMCSSIFLWTIAFALMS